MKKTNVSDSRIIHLPIIRDQRKGVITTISNSQEISFDINRVYYLYDVPSGSKRGGHAHKKLQQLIVAASGSFKIKLDDGKNSKSFFLNQPSIGLYIPQMLWRELYDFSSGGVCLVLASLPYSENDYYRDYQAFIENKRREK